MTIFLVGYFVPCKFDQRELIQKSSLWIMFTSRPKVYPAARE